MIAISIEPDAPRCRAWVRGRWRAFALAMAIVVPLITVVLMLEYRVMILCLIPLIFPVIPLGQAIRASRQLGPTGAIGVTCGADVQLVIQRGPPGPAHYREPEPPHAELVTLRYDEIGAASVMPDAIVLVRRLDAQRFQQYIVPGPRDLVKAAGALLATNGVKVTTEPSVAMIAGFLASIVLSRGLMIVAAGCVLGSLANFGLAIAKHSGSLLTGALLLGAAFCAILVSQLLRIFFTPES